MIHPHQAFALALASVFCTGGCSRAEPYEKPPTPVQVAEVQRRSTDRPLRYSAAIEPARRVDLAFRVGGYVARLARIDGRLIQEGDVVTAGMVLAAVRSEDYQVKVLQSEALVAEAEAASRAASQALARARTLYETRSLTRPELEQAEAAAESTDAKVAAARAVSREAELAKADAELTAPIAGVVLKRFIEVGSLVAPGTPSFVIADIARVKVVIGVPDTMLPRFVVGTRQRVLSEAWPDRRFEGRVSNVSPAADDRARLFEVELTVPNDDRALKPGMVASVDVGGRELDRPAAALVVPLSAVVRPPGDSDGYAVFVAAERDGTAIALVRRVRLGELMGNEVMVIDGLKEGERIIVQGAPLLADGERVDPTR